LKKPKKHKPMPMIGKNITQPNDRLFPVDLQELYQTIVNPQDSLKSLIEQIRIVQSIDIKKYQIQKLTLPYFVCAHFHPPYRNGTNAGSIEYFLIEFDQLSSKNLHPASLKDRLSKLSQVLFIFTSVGQNGIKIMFRLKSPCYDPAKFEIFYHHFASRWFRQLNIEQVIRPEQISITQSSFLTYDPDAYFNPQATPVDMDNYVDFSDFLEVNKIKKQMLNDKRQVQSETKLGETTELNPDTIAHIKQKLGIRTRGKQKISHPLTDTLPQKLDAIVQKLQTFELKVEKITTIPYGRSITVCNNQGQRVTMHIFFKPDGYNIVQSVTGEPTNTDMADVVYKVLYQHLCCKN